MVFRNDESHYVSIKSHSQLEALTSWSLFRTVLELVATLN